MDAVVAAQAFHWFDVALARDECLRILKPGGLAVLMWNTRRLNASPFLKAYERMLREFGTDYQQVHHQNVSEADRDLFLGGTANRCVLPNEQRFNFEGLKGRLLSSSYAPAEGETGCSEMLAELERIFERYSESGTVLFEYDTEVYWGSPGS